MIDILLMLLRSSPNSLRKFVFSPHRHTREVRHARTRINMNVFQRADDTSRFYYGLYCCISHIKEEKETSRPRKLRTQIHGISSRVPFRSMDQDRTNTVQKRLTLFRCWRPSGAAVPSSTYPYQKLY